jgi:hypothetical protein
MVDDRPDPIGVAVDDRDRAPAARAARVAATLLPPPPPPPPTSDADASAEAPATAAERAAWTASEALSARSRGVPAALRAAADEITPATPPTDPAVALLAASRLAAALARLPPSAGAFAALGGAPALPVGVGGAMSAEGDDDDDEHMAESEREMRGECARARAVGSTAGARKTAEAFRALSASALAALAALLPAALDEDTGGDEEDGEEDDDAPVNPSSSSSARIVDITPGPEPADPALAERKRRRRRAAARREARRRLVADALLACATYGATFSSPPALFWREIPAADETAGGAGVAANEDSGEEEDEGGNDNDGNDDDDQGHALARRVFGRAPALFSPWSDHACAQESARVLVALGAAAEKAAERAVGGGGGGGQGGGAATQQLLLLFGAVLPSHLLPDLRDALYAQARHRRALDRGDPQPYSGPGAFERAVAARRAAWLVQAVFFSANAAAAAGHSESSSSPDSSSIEALEQSGALLLPLALAAAEDPSPAVQRHGAAALLALGLCAAGGGGGGRKDAAASAAAASRLAASRRDLLLDAARRLVIGCEPGFSRVALPAASAIACAALLLPPQTAKNNDLSSFSYPSSRSGALNMRLPPPRAEPLHGLMRELLAEAERAGHRPATRRALLGCFCDPLLPAMGAYAARHLARLAPLLMEWSALPGKMCEMSRAAALAALALIARDCCCRVGGVGASSSSPDHAGVLWRRALAAARDEDVRSAAEGDGGGGEGLTRTGKAVVALARALVAADGKGDARQRQRGAASEALAAWRVASARAGGDRCFQGPVLRRVLGLLEEAAAVDDG